MAKRRCVIVHGNGFTQVADGLYRHPNVSSSGTQTTPYDLDKAMQAGAKIVEVHPIGLHAGTSMLLVVEEAGG